MADIAQVIASIALLLWGTHMVTSGMLRGYAGFLRVKLGSALQSSTKAFGAGLLATLGLQSSTATGLMAASFLEHGLFGLTTGLVMMLGANVGTALVTKLLSLPIIQLVPWLLVGGIWAFRQTKSTKGKSLGRVLIGLGLMVWSLHNLGEAALPMAQTELAKIIISSLETQVVIALVVGAIAAWVLHASVAVVLVVATLLASGALPALPALAMVLGANFGGALGPYLETQGAIAKRLPLGNLIVRGLACALVVPFLPYISNIALTFIPNPEHMAVDFHVIFNLSAALLAWPFSAPLAKWLKKLLPDPPALSDPGKPEHLDEDLLQHPYLALVAVERECVRLGAQAENILKDMEPILLDPDIHRSEIMISKSEASAKLAHEIRRYIGKVERRGMGGNDAKRSQELQSFALGAEQSLDIIKDMAQSRKNGATPVSSFLVEKDLKTINEALSLAQLACRDSIAVLMTGSVDLAREIVSSRDRLRKMEREALARQLEAKNTLGQMQAVDNWLNSLQNLRRIHSQWTSLAHQVLEHAGLLRGRIAEGTANPEHHAED